MIVRPRLSTLCVLVVGASLAVFVATGIYYLPLQVDGGWYSYPSFAYSVGRDPFSYQADPRTACGLNGLRSLFEFETTSSIRLLYASAWFRAFGGGFLALKVLSLLELAGVFTLSFLLYRRFFARRDLGLLALGFLVTDKSLLLAGVSDFRPDLAMAAASVGLFLALSARRYTPVVVVLACLLAMCTALIGPTSAVSLSFVLVSTATAALGTDRPERKTRATLVVLVGVLALLAFVGRAPLFRLLLETQVSVRDPVDVVQRIITALSGGGWAIVHKELTRWRDYFLVSNAVQLIVLLACGFAIGVRARREHGIVPKLRGPLLGLAAAILVLAVLDPHETGAHVIPLTPFMLLMLASFEGFQRPPIRGLTLSLGASAALSLALTLKIWRTNEVRNTNNWWLQSTLTDITSDMRPYILVGPTELWPYFRKERDIILVDRTRNPSRVGESGVPIRDADYVILNIDYDLDGWRSAVKTLTGDPIAVVDRAPFLTVFRLHQDSIATSVRTSVADRARVDLCVDRLTREGA